MTTVWPSALRYAARGRRVLPIRERGKEPLVSRGVHDASDDAGRIQEWATRWPDANLAIAVEEPWRILDVDPRNGGDETLRALVAEHDALPATVRARTGSGGEHYIFRVPRGVNTRGKVGPGLDLLGPGRYFLVAPSVHPCGGLYAWTSLRGVGVALMPGWLLALAVRPAMAHATPPPDATQASAPDAFERARRYVAKVGPAISGSGGHSHTFMLAQRLVRGFGLPDRDAYAILAEWNRACSPPWSEHDLRRKIREARERGGTIAPGELLGRRRTA